MGCMRHLRNDGPAAPADHVKHGNKPAALLAVLFVVVSFAQWTTPVFAHGANGGRHPPGNAGGHRFHGVPRAYFGAYAGRFYQPFYPYGFYPYSLYPYFNPYYPPFGRTPSAYTDKDLVGPVLNPTYRYYCNSAGNYYPGAANCPEDWQPVAPQPE